MIYFISNNNNNNKYININILNKNGVTKIIYIFKEIILISNTNYNLKLNNIL